MGNLSVERWIPWQQSHQPATASSQQGGPGAFEAHGEPLVWIRKTDTSDAQFGPLSLLKYASVVVSDIITLWETTNPPYWTCRHHNFCGIHLSRYKCFVEKKCIKKIIIPLTLLHLQ